MISYADNAAGRMKERKEESVPYDGQTVETILKALCEEVDRAVNVQANETEALSRTRSGRTGHRE